MSRWKLTVRHGSDVEHEGFDDLDAAIAAMKSWVGRVQAEGPLQGSSVLRDFEPGDLVHARLQVSGKGLLRKPVAGIDVQGDGSLVAFRGGLQREELEASGQATPFDAVREALAGEER